MRKISFGNNARTGANNHEIMITVCLAILFSILVFALFYNRNTWKEDVDGDGVDEIVKEIRNRGRQLERWVIKEDGIMYQTRYEEELGISIAFPVLME